jgi:putative flippase GtrA
LNKKLRELVLYLIFGVLTTVVNFAVYYPLYYLMGSGWAFRLFGLFPIRAYAVASVVAWLAAVAFAYVTNKLLVFESRSWERRVVAREAASFYGARVLSLGVELLGLYLMNDLLAIGRFGWTVYGFSIGGEDISKLLMQAVVIALNYLFSKLWIFSKTKGEE